MPKCEADPVLQDQVHRFMKENGLTVSGAAVKLGVDRLHFGGSVIPVGLAAIRERCIAKRSKNETKVLQFALQMMRLKRMRSRFKHAPPHKGCWQTLS